jgi:hypothetical protein
MSSSRPSQAPSPELNSGLAGTIPNEICNFASYSVVEFKYAMCNVFYMLTGLILYGFTVTSFVQLN